MNWILLHKYLSEESSPEELQRVEDWLQADERNLRFVKSLQEIWDVEPDDEIEVDAKSAWNSFQHKISPAQEATAERKASTYKIRELREKSIARKAYKRTIAMALSAAAVVLVVFLFARYVSPDKRTSQPQLAMQEIVTAKGQRTTFRLSDGTRVQLNADSKMEIPKSFRDSARKVYLDGYEL